MPYVEGLFSTVLCRTGREVMHASLQLGKFDLQGVTFGSGSLAL
jgi:hypothetical protein